MGKRNLFSLLGVLFLFSAVTISGIHFSSAEKADAALVNPGFEISLDLTNDNFINIVENSTESWNENFTAHTIQFSDVGSSYEGTIEFELASKQNYEITNMPVLDACATSTFSEQTGMEGNSFRIHPMVNTDHKLTRISFEISPSDEELFFGFDLECLNDNGNRMAGYYCEYNQSTHIAVIQREMDPNFPILEFRPSGDFYGRTSAFYGFKNITLTYGDIVTKNTLDEFAAREEVIIQGDDTVGEYSENPKKSNTDKAVYLNTQCYYTFTGTFNKDSFSESIIRIMQQYSTASDTTSIYINLENLVIYSRNPDVSAFDFLENNYPYFASDHYEYREATSALKVVFAINGNVILYSYGSPAFVLPGRNSSGFGTQAKFTTFRGGRLIALNGNTYADSIKVVSMDNPSYETITVEQQCVDLRCSSVNISFPVDGEMSASSIRDYVDRDENIVTCMDYGSGSTALTQCFTSANDGLTPINGNTPNGIQLEFNENHYLTMHDAVNATCTHGGNIAYSECNECHTTFTGSIESLKPVDYTKINTSDLGGEHELSGYYGFDSFTHWKKCSKCDEKIDIENHNPEFTYYWADESKTVLYGKLVCECGYNYIAQTSDITWTYPTDVRCGDYATAHYYARNFSFSLVPDYEGTEEIMVDHTWSEPSYTWNEDYTVCTATKHCLNPLCGQEKSATATDYNENIVSSPTCTEPGLKYVQASFDEIPDFSGCTTQTEVVIPAIGHILNEDWHFDDTTHYRACSRDCGEIFDNGNHIFENADYHFSTDYSFCNVYASCSVCGYSIEITTENITRKNVNEIKCGETGTLEITADFSEFNSLIEPYSVYEETTIEHIFSDITYSWNEDNTICTAEHHCTNPGCDFVEKEDSIAVNSTVSKYPTCEDEGENILTAVFGESGPFASCSATKTITSPANGHNGGTTYYSDANEHWQICENEGCGEKINVSEHFMAVQSMTWNEGKTICTIFKKCSVCGYEETSTVEQQGEESITEELSKEIINPTEDSGLSKEEIDEAIETVPEEQLENIVETITESMNEIAELQAQIESATGEEKEELEKKLENNLAIVNVVSESSVVIAADQVNNEEKAQQLNESIPEDTGLDMEQTFNNFYDKVMAELLGGTYEAPTKLKKIFKEEPIPKKGLDFDLSLDKYKTAMEFADISVEHMTMSAETIKICQGSEIKAEVKNYITKVSVSSFRDFDRAAADAEFVENAYNAILMELQNQVRTSLNEEYENGKKSLSGQALQDFTDLYNSQLEAVNDLETFEIMVTEVMRIKYLNVMYARYNDGLLSDEELAVVNENGKDVEIFAPIYKDIFTSWCLQTENDYGISLEELTQATVEEVSLTKNSKSTYRGKMNGLEIGLVAGTGVLLIGGLVILGLCKKKEN